MKSKKIRRKAARSMTCRFRDYANTVNDNVKIKRIKSMLQALMLSDDGEDFDLFLLCVAYYRRLKYAKVDIFRNRQHVTIESFQHDCLYHRSWKSVFGFRKEDLYLLVELLRIPDVIYLKNKSVFSSEEMLLVCLYRYKSISEMDTMCMHFKRDHSQISRAFQWFNTFTIQEWGHKLDDNLRFWRDKFPFLADAIRRKVNDLSHGALFFAEGEFDVVAFIDCSVNRCSRPGAGPAANGEVLIIYLFTYYLLLIYLFIYLFTYLLLIYLLYLLTSIDY
jgi:hypothetical protein